MRKNTRQKTAKKSAPFRLFPRQSQKVHQGSKKLKKRNLCRQFGNKLLLGDRRKRPRISAEKHDRKTPWRLNLRKILVNQNVSKQYRGENSPGKSTWNKWICSDGLS